MGFVPILLALSGFVFLWAIVNYHSLSSLQKAIQTQQEERRQLQLAAGQLIDKLSILLKIYGISLPPFWANIATQSSVLEKERLLSEIEQLNRLSQGNTQLQNEPDFLRIKEDLHETIVKLFNIQQKLFASLRDYNNLSQSMPSRIVANVFGFKPVKG